MSGVFDTYPRLKIIIGHLGEGLSSTSGASAAGSAAVTAASRSATSSASTLGHDQWVLRSLALVLGDGDGDRLDPVLRRLSFVDNPPEAKWIETLPLSAEDEENC